MKNLIWEYNGKYYLKINDAKVKEVADMLRKDALQIETCFKQDLPYHMDLTFKKKMILRRVENILKGIQFLKLINHLLNTNI